MPAQLKLKGVHDHRLPYAHEIMSSNAHPSLPSGTSSGWKQFTPQRKWFEEKTVGDPLMTHAKRPMPTMDIDQRKLGLDKKISMVTCKLF
jgi:hypothetical protein